MAEARREPAVSIQIVAPALPPLVDGIGDHSARLATELSRLADVGILAPDDARHAAIAGVPIESVFSTSRPWTVRNLVGAVERTRPDWLVLQYNPFSWGRWGWNPFLPLAMGALRRTCPSTRIALVVHEPYVLSTSWKNAVMASWQRWQLGALARSADAIFCTVQAWMRALPDGRVRSRAVHLPVGSAIPRVGMPREEARARLGIRGRTRVLGVFGTAHPSRMLERVRDAAAAARRAGSEVLVLYVGPDPAVVRDRLRDTAVVAKGPLPAEEVSRRLAAVDVYLAPFADGVSTRRTSLMAGLQHGLPTVGTRGAFTDAVLRREHGRAMLLADVADAAAFEAHVLRLLSDDTFRRRVGIEARQFYEREFAWPRIAQRMFTTLAAGIGASTAVLPRTRAVVPADGAPAAGVA